MNSVEVSVVENSLTGQDGIRFKKKNQGKAKGTISLADSLCNTENSEERKTPVSKPRRLKGGPSNDYYKGVLELHSD